MSEFKTTEARLYSEALRREQDHWSQCSRCREVDQDPYFVGPPLTRCHLGKKLWDQHEAAYTALISYGKALDEVINYSHDDPIDFHNCIRDAVDAHEAECRCVWKKHDWCPIYRKLRLQETETEIEANRYWDYLAGGRGR